MKKFLSMMLAVVMLLCMIPSTAVFAAKENFIKITEATVNEVPSPAAGTEVQFTANCETKYVAINSVKWYEKKTESESGTALAQGAKFKPGYYYTVSVELQISHNSYYFAGNGADVTATVNGKEATTTTNNAQVMTVSRTFPMCLTTVSKFEFNLAAPVAGAAPHYPLLTGTGYKSDNRGNNGAAYENGIYWRNETDNKVLYPDENPKFEAGKTYSANVTVATTTGYRVASSYSVKVNGKTVNATKVDNECITFKVEFKVPKAHTHTESGWKSDADNHWKICTEKDCGAITTEKTAHKDANKDNKCDVCSYAISKDTPAKQPDSAQSNTSTPDASSDATTGSDDTASDKDIVDTDTAVDEDADADETVGADEGETDEKENDNSGKKKSSLLWLWIVLAVVVLGAGGAVAFIVIKKKKSEV